ncbi:M48 family metalloprotease [Phormidium sp. LEGE 05292]|uniref:M48 family metallopeptidase n=1 Tax=[Phormidium] sp. LEGE 05292 TaxID=767427 RepID=UPI00187F9BED|nr:M48 family metallopeptidase [Phormidium sp. LEGE 05292]MBE9224247.1 M48 family metalloprotease [Phormidium sp. LEGE 05292]
MMMTDEKFDALVKRLEIFAHSKPASYKLRVGLLAVLGYAYIVFVLVGLLLALGLVVLLVLWSHRINGAVIKFAFLLLIVIFIILRSLWVTFPPPQGLPLNRREFPRLFAFVDELSTKLQAPRFHHILLTNELNAAVIQRPRLGLFGWQQNYLILGLPLMQALSPRQFQAVLAHELGHLSGNHSRFAGWIYRVRLSHTQIWQRLYESGQHGSSFLFEAFFKWYFPFFGAYSFVLARMNEYEADRCAAELAGAKNTAEALMNVEVKARFLENTFWPNLYKQVQHQVEPPTKTFTKMSSALASSLPDEDTRKFINQALAQKTNNADTHPCLSDRLKALGFFAEKSENLPSLSIVKVNAAQQLLEDKLNEIAAYFDTTWKEQISTTWRQQYAQVQQSLKQLKTLEEKAAKQKLTDEEAWERVRLTAQVSENEAIIPLLQEILMNQPNHAAANYSLGQILLQKNDFSGIEYLENAMKKDPDCVMEACEIIYYFLLQQNKEEEAIIYQKRAKTHYELLLKAQQERSFVDKRDKFIPHNLPDKEITLIYQQLSRYPEIKQAYLVRKKVTYFPEKPFYVLGITQQKAWYKWHISDQDQKLLNKIISEVEFPGQAYIILLNDYSGYNKEWGKIIGNIEGACIYSC